VTMMLMVPKAEQPGPEPLDDDLPSLRRQVRPQREEIDMDITPMIDMTFLLLIFFLVSSTPDQQTAIDLPPAQHGVGVSQLESIVFTIAAGGVNVAPVYAADGRVPGTELPEERETRRARVRELVEEGFRDDKTDVVIKGDKNVAHRDVAQLVRAASQVNGVKIHLAVLDAD
jgi:biopolymer transport protein ExbD